MSLELLKVVQFWKIVETNNIESLNINHKTGVKYSEEQIILLAEHWKNLYDDFYDRRNSKSGKYTFAKNIEIARLSLILDILGDIENRLIILNNMVGSKELIVFVTIRLNEAIEDLKKLHPKVKVPMFSTPLEVLTIVQSVIKAQTNIFDEKVGVVEKTVAKQKETIFDIIAIMSKILGYRLDVSTMSCMEFIGHENAINSMSKNK